MLFVTLRNDWGFGISKYTWGSTNYTVQQWRDSARRIHFLQNLREDLRTEVRKLG